MKVLMQGRSELIRSGGGDKIQVENTAKELRNLGISVDISTSDKTDLKPYDVVHVFQLDWTPETYFYALNAKKAGKPLVLSPIHHNLEEVKKFDDEYAFDFRRLSKVLFKNQHHRDTLKNVYRIFFNPDKLFPTVKSIFIGLENMHKNTLKLADVVLVQTNAEAMDLKSAYGVDFRWVKIPNGVSDVFIKGKNYVNKLEISDYILSVGRIEPRKNQLKIIEAVKQFRQKNKLDIKLVFVGAKRNNRHFEYLYKFNKELKASPWIIHINDVKYEDMPSIYHFAKITVSASWFETTGLTLLESLFSGTNAVAAGARAQEILGNYASYCLPDNVEGIKEAIEKEYFSERPLINSSMLLEYTWENAAKKTMEVYKSLVNK